MTVYSFSSLGPQLPPAPILPIRIKHLEVPEESAIECYAFLDTGADCTQIALSKLSKIKATFGPSDMLNSLNTQIQTFTAYIDIQLAHHQFKAFKVYGCRDIDMTDGARLIILG